mgnify:CR=1 FL=1
MKSTRIVIRRILRPLIFQGKWRKILLNNFFSGKAFTLPLILNKAEALKNSWEERLSTPGSPAELKDQEVWPIIESENEELNDSIMSKITTKKELSPTGEF